MSSARGRALVVGLVFAGCAQEPPPAQAPIAARVAPSPRPSAPRPQARNAPSTKQDAQALLEARYGSAPALQRFRGEASYYGDSLAGHRTANGERYDPQAFTAAHRNLPFKSVVRVVREDTAQVVYVRVNDRGPFVRGRVIDLSRAAAADLGLLRRGVARVRVEVVEYGPPPVQKKRKRSRRKH